MEASSASRATQSSQSEAVGRIKRKIGLDQFDEGMKFLPNHKFVLTAATVTFRGANHVLIVHNTNPKYNETFFTLPGGRKNIGETLETAAIRETLEETGYHVHVPHANIPTRATRSRVSENLHRKWQDRFQLPDDLPTSTTSPPVQGCSLVRSASTTSSVVSDRNKEPVCMITYTDSLADYTKLRFVFYATLVDADQEPHAPALDSGEYLQAEWVSVEEALAMLRFEAEREAVRSTHALHVISGNGTGEDEQSRGTLTDMEYAERCILFVMEEAHVSRDVAVQALRLNQDVFEVALGLMSP
ncbi:unnamed protein product [Discula destructiva]